MNQLWQDLLARPLILFQSWTRLKLVNFIGHQMPTCRLMYSWRSWKAISSSSNSWFLSDSTLSYTVDSCWVVSVFISSSSKHFSSSPTKQEQKVLQRIKLVFFGFVKTFYMIVNLENSNSRIFQHKPSHTSWNHKKHVLMVRKTTLKVWKFHNYVLT